MITDGEVPERLNGAVSKTVDDSVIPGFESLPLRQKENFLSQSRKAKKKESVISQNMQFPMYN